jgi:hypothetical protein
MAMLKVEKNHSLGLNEATNRVKKFGNFLTKNGINVTWNSANEAKITGKYLIVSIDATVTVSQDTVVICGKDPGFLWRRKAEQFLDEKMGEYLS